MNVTEQTVYNYLKKGLLTQTGVAYRKDNTPYRVITKMDLDLFLTYKKAKQENVSTTLALYLYQPNPSEYQQALNDCIKESFVSAFDQANYVYDLRIYEDKTDNWAQGKQFNELCQHITDHQIMKLYTVFPFHYVTTDQKACWEKFLNDHHILNESFEPPFLHSVLTLLDHSINSSVTLPSDKYLIRNERDFVFITQVLQQFQSSSSAEDTEQTKSISKQKQTSLAKEIEPQTNHLPQQTQDIYAKLLNEKEDEISDKLNNYQHLSRL